eukprot:3421539-Pyramimonas_sp.AAC.2
MQRLCSTSRPRIRSPAPPRILSFVGACTTSALKCSRPPSVMLYPMPSFKSMYVTGVHSVGLPARIPPSQPTNNLQISMY